MDPLPKPLNERLDLTLEENIEFFRIVMSAFDWASSRVWSQLLYFNRQHTALEEHE